MTSAGPEGGSTGGVDRHYLEPDRDVDERVEILLGQMTLEEKAGQFFHAMISIGPDGALSEANPDFSLPSTRQDVVESHLSHFNVLGQAPSPRVMALWHNRLQELAASTRLGIPVTLSTDPRHSFSDNPGTAVRTGWFSQWPEQLGLAAIGDEALVERFGDIARQEYLAVGLRVALHPQIDLTTESRWARQIGSFGEDAELTGRLGAAYVRGFQGPELGADSVATMTKHFPGGGPHLDGEDPHFAYGREQVYPGGNLAYHMSPFEPVFGAGGSQIMPYYGMPVGLEFEGERYEEVGFAFNKQVITGLLRGRFGFDGIVCADWGVLNDSHIYGDFFPARAWGVEHLSPYGRAVKAIDAGVDQFGGERDPALIVRAVTDGAISMERIDVSVRRLLREKFRLGLFERRAVDPDAAEALVGREDFVAAGQRAQSEAIVALEAGAGVLPLAEGVAVYVEGVDPAALAAYARVVERVEDADVAILRLHAPYEQRATTFENHFHAGTLEFPAGVVDHVLEVAAAVPTVLDVFLERPAVLTPFAGKVAALTGNFGANPRALLDVLFGRETARGRLPFDLPRSDAAAAARRSDVPFDTADPLFRFGHGVVAD